MKFLAPASLAVLGLLASGAGAAGDTAAGAKPAAPVAGSCFWIRDVSNFAAVDDQHVYVRVGVRDVYELKLLGNCLDLSWVHRLGLRSRTSSDICEGHNPDLEVFDREVGIGPQRCPVTDVRKLTADQAAALPKGARP